MRQSCRTLGRSLRRDDVSLEVAEPALGHAQLDQLEATADAGQQVVEVVCKAACQLADRFHLLGLPELFLEQPSLGGLDGHACPAHRLAVRV